MTFEPPEVDPNDGPVTSPWGAYQPPGRDDVVELGLARPGSRRVVIGAAVAVAALLGGAGVAYAASGGGSAATLTSAGASPSPSASAGAPAPPSIHCQMMVKGSAKSKKQCPPFGRFGFRPFGIPGPPGGPEISFPLGVGGAVHGQLVVPKSGGGYLTIDVQRGKVTAVSSTSLTVKSADGFSATYAVSSSTLVDAQRDGIGSVKDGNQVYVTATVSGSKATATSIADLSLLKAKGGPFGFGWNSPPQ